MSKSVVIIRHIADNSIMATFGPFDRYEEALHWTMNRLAKSDNHYSSIHDLQSPEKINERS